VTTDGPSDGPASRLQALVFDFDGTLADSMSQHAEAYRRVLTPYGVRPEDREIFVLEGARSESIIRHLLMDAGFDPAAEDLRRLANEKQTIYAALGDPPLYGGVDRILSECRGLVSYLGLVTGTRRENLEKLLPGSLPLFDAVLAQDAYSHDKPHPEPYARAAERLGIPPARCVAVENALRGVQSAQAAGYGAIIGIATTMAPETLRDAGATVTAPNHDALMPILRRWFA